MTQDTPSQHSSTTDDTEVLIGRLVDGEATPQDHQDFDRLAAGETGLWRTLALRQLEMTMLSERVLARTGAADRIEVAPGPRRRLNLPLMLSGWAAVLVLGAWWAVSVGRGDGASSPARLEPVGSAAVEGGRLTPDEHLQQYLQAAFVLGELDPVLLDRETLEDGRHRLRILRRIEEYIDISSPPEALVDDRGRLAIDPGELRNPDS